MKKGFSLAELMVSLVILAIIAAVIMPTVLSIPGNTNKYLYRKAFQLTESVVSDLIGNTTMYPTGSFTNSTGYFCNNFANEMNTLGTVNCNTSTLPSGGTGGSPNFITSNGMAWFGLENAFAANAIITVSIDNGKAGNVTHLDLTQIIITPAGKLTTPATGNETTYLTQ